MNALDRLQQRLEYRFADWHLLERAVTHRSFGGKNNERLEFLGDAVLGMVIAERLYQQEQEREEGDLSRLRASLVNRDSLAEIAAALEVGECLRLGPGEMKSGGHRRASVLSDALEAIIGAVYLDGGFDSAAKLIARLFDAKLASLPDAGELIDPKTRLQERLQGQGLELPQYEVIDASGPPHKRRFRVKCRVESLNFSTEAEGRSRRAAEQSAAENALMQLDEKYAQYNRK